MNPELLAAVRERIALGHTDEMIQTELQQTGYSAAAITEILLEAKAANNAPKPSPTLPSGGVLVRQGWEFVKKYPLLGILLAIPFAILEIGNYLLETVIKAESTEVLFGVATMGAVVVQLLCMVLAYRVVWSATEGTPISLAAAWHWARAHAISFLWISILTMLVVWGGLVLFIVPAFIFALYLFFAQYVFVAEGTKGMAALVRSKELVQGQWWLIASRLAVVALYSFGVMLAFALVLVLLEQALEPIWGENNMIVAVLSLFGSQVISAFFSLIGLRVGAEMYRALAAAKPAASGPQAEKGMLVTFAWLGLLFPIIIAGYFVFLASVGQLPSDDWSNDEYQNSAAKERAIELRQKE
jgi:hypothetical protein